MKIDSLKRRLLALTPAAPSLPRGIKALNDAELDAKIENLIRRLEQRRDIMPDFIHRELSCERCTGNNRTAWCYSWKESGELQICSPGE